MVCSFNLFFCTNVITTAVGRDAQCLLRRFKNQCRFIRCGKGRMRYKGSVDYMPRGMKEGKARGRGQEEHVLGYPACPGIAQKD